MANLRPLRKFLKIILETAFPGTAVNRLWGIYSRALPITVEPNQDNTRKCCHLTPALILNTNQSDLLKLDLPQFYSFHSFPKIHRVSHPLRVRVKGVCGAPVTSLTSLSMALLVTHCCNHIPPCSHCKALAYAIPHLDHPPLRHAQGPCPPLLKSLPSHQLSEASPQHPL